MSVRSPSSSSPYPHTSLLVGIVTLSVLSSAALTTGAILGGQAWRRRRLREGLKDEAERDLRDLAAGGGGSGGEKATELDLDDDLGLVSGVASGRQLDSGFTTSGISTPARPSTSTSTPGGVAGGMTPANDPLGKDWKRGEYDESLVREQVSVLSIRESVKKRSFGYSSIIILPLMPNALSIAVSC